MKKTEEIEKKLTKRLRWKQPDFQVGGFGEAVNIVKPSPEPSPEPEIPDQGTDPVYPEPDPGIPAPTPEDEPPGHDPIIPPDPVYPPLPPGYMVGDQVLRGIEGRENLFEVGTFIRYDQGKLMVEMTNGDIITVEEEDIQRAPEHIDLDPTDGRNPDIQFQPEGENGWTVGNFEEDDPIWYFLNDGTVMYGVNYENEDGETVYDWVSKNDYTENTRPLMYGDRDLRNLTNDDFIPPVINGIPIVNNVRVYHKDGGGLIGARDILWNGEYYTIDKENIANYLVAPDKPFGLHDEIEHAEDGTGYYKVHATRWNQTGWEIQTEKNQNWTEASRYKNYNLTLDEAEGARDHFFHTLTQDPNDLNANFTNALAAINEDQEQVFDEQHGANAWQKHIFNRVYNDRPLRFEDVAFHNNLDQAYVHTDENGNRMRYEFKGLEHIDTVNAMNNRLIYTDQKGDEHIISQYDLVHDDNYNAARNEQAVGNYFIGTTVQELGWAGNNVGEATVTDVNEDENWIETTGQDGHKSRYYANALFGAGESPLRIVDATGDIMYHGTNDNPIVDRVNNAQNFTDEGLIVALNELMKPGNVAQGNREYAYEALIREYPEDWETIKNHAVENGYNITDVYAVDDGTIMIGNDEVSLDYTQQDPNRFRHDYHLPTQDELQQQILYEAVHEDDIRQGEFDQGGLPAGPVQPIQEDTTQAPLEDKDEP